MIVELQGTVVSHCVLKRAVGLNYILLRLAITTRTESILSTHTKNIYVAHLPALLR